MTKRETKKAKRNRLAEVLRRLEEHYGDEKPALNFHTPYQLLIAVILSAQCTDVRVNKVTDKLFMQFDTAEKMSRLSPEELEPMIRSCGLSKTKSKNIILTSQKILDSFGGNVPQNIDTLQTLPGVGRKTANVVASVAFGVPAIAVDTHVFRVSNRIGLAEAKDVNKTEQQLMEVIPKDKWSRAHHWLIWHGRRVCASRKPACRVCFLLDVCIYGMQTAVSGEQ